MSVATRVNSSRREPLVALAAMAAGDESAAARMTRMEPPLPSNAAHAARTRDARAGCDGRAPGRASAAAARPPRPAHARALSGGRRRPARLHPPAAPDRRSDTRARACAPRPSGKELAASEAADTHLVEKWRTVVEGWDFSDGDDLIDQHNRWYAVRANLPMDPRTGDYALLGGRPYARDRLMRRGR